MISGCSYHVLWEKNRHTDERQKTIHAPVGYSGQDEGAAEKKAYMEMADKDLFFTQDVKISLKTEDTPGTPVTRTRCTLCCETILDKHDVQQDNKVFCRPCATGQSYYTFHSPVLVKLDKALF